MIDNVINVILILVIGILVGIIIGRSHITIALIKKQLEYWREKIISFIKHSISLIPVFICLAITYYVSEKIFSYGEQILSNLISTGLSVVIIDFLLKERQKAEQKKINLLIASQIQKMKKNINDILLKFISVEDGATTSIDNDLLVKILDKQELSEPSIAYEQFTVEGKVEELNICKFDFPYYVAQEIEDELEKLLSNFLVYIDNKKACELIKLREVLRDNNIFKVRYSTYGNVTKEEYEIFKQCLIQALIELNAVNQKI